MPTLAMREKIRLEISFPKNGFILILNEQLDNSEVTALVPSPLRRDAAAGTKRPLVLPEKHDLTGGGPLGYYRMYGIWTKDSLERDLVEAMACGTLTEFGPNVLTLDSQSLRRITDALARDGRLFPGRRIVALDYKVVPRAP